MSYDHQNDDRFNCLNDSFWERRRRRGDRDHTHESEFFVFLYGFHFDAGFQKHFKFRDAWSLFDSKTKHKIENYA